MKNFLALFSLLAIVLVFVFIRCGQDYFFVPGGIAGFSQGVLLDRNGNPIMGSTIWIPGAGFVIPYTAQSGGPLAFVDSQGNTCPDPEVDGTPVETVAGITCTDLNGNFILECAGDNIANVTNAAGVLIGTITLTNCGGDPQDYQMDVDPQPTPDGTPTPTPTTSPSPSPR